ncbi:ras guanine nucleotide exchange factor domain-containing protein [Phycomyces nitens]|nr:ras guanine nucleotide exchange factor domain-containing protein [Phycomyces nitens]
MKNCALYLSSLPDQTFKRRSKSFDDLNNAHSIITPPASPIIAFDPDMAVSPKRRHSSCIESTSKECLRLATIYGWVTLPGSSDYLSSQSHKDHTERPARATRPSQPSRSLSQTNISHQKLLTKMFARRRKSLAASRLQTDPISDRPSSSLGTSLFLGQNDSRPSSFDCSSHKGIVSAIMAASLTENEQTASHALGWVGVEEQEDPEQEDPYVTNTPPPPPPPPLPVENDPHVYDLLAQDNPSFIHYSNRNLTMMSSATVEKLVEKLTREMDSDFLMDFFLTYRQFVTPIKLCKLLILRFRWALMQDSDERQLVRIRTFVAIRHWLTHYWSHDFIPSRTLRFILCTFLSQLRTHPVILQSPRDERIIKNLRNVLKRQRKLFDIENESGSLLSMGSLVDMRHNSQQCDQSSRISATSHHPKKDGAVGLIHTGGGSLRDLKASVSTPVLPFLARPRRLSTSSQRSVNEDTAWTAKMNFSIKTLKRSVPTICHSLMHGISFSNDPSHIRCMCDKHSVSLLNSSRSFQISSTPLSSSISTPTLRHPNPLCPLNTTNEPPPSPLPKSARSKRFISFPANNSPQSPSSALASFSYKPFVLRHRSEIVAQQFCLIEQQMLQNVTWDELAELRWRKRSRAMATNISQEPLHEGVEQLIGFFNKICQWVASEIVKTRSIETRVRTIEKFIRIALKCYHQRNYSTLMQVLLGLQSPAVSRLEKTWQRVDHYELHIFGELKELAKPFRNWKNVRDCMTRATEDVAESSAVESILTQSETDPGHTLSGRGCIPFLGLYLSDLVFNSELPTYIEHSTNEESSKTPVEDAVLSARLSTRLVNYNKFRITGK